MNESVPPRRPEGGREAVVNISRERSNGPVAVGLALFLLFGVGLLAWSLEREDWELPDFASLVPEPAPPSEAESRGPEPDADESAWTTARQSGSAEGYQAYLAAWPQGAHAEEARTAVALLRDNAALKEQAAALEREERKVNREDTPAALKPKAAPRVAQGPRAGEVFRDCTECPEMVVIPAGQFFRGEEPASEKNLIRITRRFAAGVHEVTFEQWDACVDAGGCGGYRPDDEGWGRGFQPVVGLNFADAEAYLQWLSIRTGRRYRFLSENEWEYVARAGTSTGYWWGERIGVNNAACDGCETTQALGPKPVGSFEKNPFGLYDTNGNVWEWVEDCENVYGGPSKTQAPEKGSCEWRYIRGGAWNVEPAASRASSRYRLSVSDRGVGNSGLRVALWLDP